MFNRSYKDMKGGAAAPPGAPGGASLSAEDRRRGAADDDQTSHAEKSLQSGKFDKIVEILVSAGYFRARLDLLSAFDKVVGGLCWCIETSGEGVDVDILFTENSTIGQKIKLSESIVAAVRQMECPFSLQAHQIQGSDWNACHPVIVWLVKKFFETREQTKEILRDHSHMQFGKAYDLPEEAAKAAPSAGFLADVGARYAAERRFRKARGEGADANDEVVRVQSCLFEYGERVGEAIPEGQEAAAAQAAGMGSGLAAVAAAGLGEGAGAKDADGLSAFERQFLAAQQAAARDEEAQRLADAAREKDLIAEMAAIEGGFANTADGANVGALMSMGGGAIAGAAAQYEREQAELKRMLEEMESGGERGGRRAELAAHKRQVAALSRQIEESGARAEAAAAEQAAVKARLDAVTAELGRAMQYNARIAREDKKLDAIEASSGMSAELAKLRQLVMLNESMKTQEGDFKGNCKRQLGVLQAALEKLKSSENQDQEIARLKEIERMHAEMMAKYTRLRQLLAARNQAIANTSRLIDDIPTRTELIQYERRFVELYGQVAAKLDETRKYFNSYNTLDDTLKYLQKEVTLLNSVTTSFSQAMTNAQGKEQYLSQFKTICSSVRQLLAQQQGTLRQKQSTVDALENRFNTLAEEQRAYFRAVKEFQVECDRNEALAQKEAKKAGKKK